MRAKLIRLSQKSRDGSAVEVDEFFLIRGIKAEGRAAKITKVMNSGTVKARRKVSKVALVPKYPATVASRA